MTPFIWLVIGPELAIAPELCSFPELSNLSELAKVPLLMIFAPNLLVMEPESELVIVALE